MLDQVYLNGRFLHSGDAALNVTDLSILRGYGVFDFFRYSDGKPRFLSDHLSRFSGSAALLNLKLPVEELALSNVIQELIQRNRILEGGIKLVLTGGYSDDGYTPLRPNLLGIAYPHTPPRTELYQVGCTVMLHHYERQLPQAKTIDYLEGIRLQPLLRQVGADYPLYVDRDNYVRESDRSNVLIVSEGVMLAPSENILRGITRMHVLEMARNLGIEVREAAVSLAQLTSADEAIICSTVKGLVPITKIIGGRLSDNTEMAIGPVTTRLMERWEKYAKSPDR